MIRMTYRLYVDAEEPGDIEHLTRVVEDALEGLAGGQVAVSYVQLGVAEGLPGDPGDRALPAERWNAPL